ncbi:kinase-like domain-containing protein [Xylariaceae sp. FL0594]|nr:kinase-like domain-containing protein [Xylariaceae sp. FL0594]
MTSGRSGGDAGANALRISSVSYRPVSQSQVELGPPSVKPLKRHPSHQDHGSHRPVEDEIVAKTVESPTQPSSSAQVEARLVEAGSEIVAATVESSSTQPFLPGDIAALLAETIEDEIVTISVVPSSRSHTPSAAHVEARQAGDKAEAGTESQPSSTSQSADLIETRLSAGQLVPLDLTKLSIESLALPDPSCHVLLLPKDKDVEVLEFKGNSELDGWITVNTSDNNAADNASSSTAKILAITPSADQLGFTVRHLDHGLSIDFLFDPSLDRLVLRNNGLDPMLATPKGDPGDPALQPLTAAQLGTIGLSPGVWSLGTEQEQGLFELKVLERYAWQVTTTLSAKRGFEESAPAPKRGKLADGRVVAGPAGTSRSMPEGNALLNLANREIVHIGIGADRNIVVKIIKPSTTNVGDTIRAARMWADELSVHSSLEKHTAISQFLGSDARFYSIYTEHIDARALTFHTNTADGSFRGTDADVRRVLSDMASALSFLHAGDYVHNDIKPANILYNQDRGAVLIDFGQSFKKGNEPRGGGSPWYLAPEFLRTHKLRGAKSDVWALGVVMLWLLGKIKLPESTGHGWVIADIYPDDPRRLPHSEHARNAMPEWTELMVTHASTLEEDPTSLEGIVKRMLEYNHFQRIGFPTVLERLQGQTK